MEFTCAELGRVTSVISHLLADSKIAFFSSSPGTPRFVTGERTLKDAEVWISG